MPRQWSRDRTRLSAPGRGRSPVYGAGSADQIAALRAEVASLERELEQTTGRVFMAHHGAGVPGQDQVRLAAIVRASEDAIYSMAADTTILTWNAGAEHLLGYGAEQIIGRSGRCLVPDDQLTAFEGALDRIREGEHALAYDAWRVRHDGTRIEVSVSLAGIRERDGSLAGFGAVLRDLVPRRRAEAAIAAIEADRLMHEERERIASNLGQRIISRIFAIGLEVQASASLAEAPVERRLRAVVDQLDDTITELRSVIVGLRQGPQP